MIFINLIHFLCLLGLSVQSVIVSIYAQSYVDNEITKFGDLNYDQDELTGSFVQDESFELQKDSAYCFGTFDDSFHCFSYNKLTLNDTIVVHVNQHKEIVKLSLTNGNALDNGVAVKIESAIKGKIPNLEPVIKVKSGKPVKTEVANEEGKEEEVSMAMEFGEI